MQAKIIGIVIPIYNIEEYLRECLDSVINQTYTNLEIVLVNDGSTDKNSLNIAKEYALKDKRITLFDKKNGGQSTARNVGIEYFSGEFCFGVVDNNFKTNGDLVEFCIKNQNDRNIYKIYKSSIFFKNEEEILNFKNPSIDFIVFIDPDDYWSLNCIEECVKRSNGMDIVWFDYRMFYDGIDEKYYKNKTNLTKSQMQIYEYYKPEKITSMQWLQRCLKIQAELPFWCVCGGIYSFAYLQKIKLKFLDGLIHEDVHFGMLLFAQAENIYVFPKVLYYYRIRSASTASYDKTATKANISPYIQDLCDVFNGDIKITKEYHAKSSIFLNAWHVREFIANIYDKEKGTLLEEAFFMFLYFWHFDLKNFKKDPRNVLELHSVYKPVYSINQDRYPEYNFVCKYGFAKDRIKNQLTYRLGKLIIERTKKVVHILMLPYDICKLIINFKIERQQYKKITKKNSSLVLPKLELYPDFNEIWKVKEHLSFKIGNLILKTHKSWYKGAYFLLPYRFYKLFKQHKTTLNRITISQSAEQLTKDQFIWNDKKLINISINKDVFQSSMSVLNHKHNPNNMLSNVSNLFMEYYTDFTDNPWFIVDLHSSYLIEKLRITNVKNQFARQYLKGVNISFSLDGNYWTTIPSEKINWKYNDYCCELILSECLEARFARISIQKGVLSLSKIEIFSRKKNGYIISAKPDGLGMRLASILIGMYLAKKCNFDFGFIWPNSIDLAFTGIMDSKKTHDINYLGNAMDEVDAVFDLKFIDEYLINDSYVNENHGIEIRRKNNSFKHIQDKNNFETDWGWYSTDIIPSFWLNDCSEKECLEEISQIYKDISFSQKFNSIIQESHSKIKDRFVALHIRGGDIIFANIRKVPGWNVIQERYFPYEIAIDIIEKELDNDYNIVIFGQDLNANKTLVEYFKNPKICLVDDYIDDSYNEMERSFFEINLMSLAEKIYSAKESVFSKVAMMISGKNSLISYHDLYSNDEQFNIITNNLFRIKLHKLQNARAYFRLYELTKDKDIVKSMSFLRNALELDDDNDAYRIYILDCLIKLKRYEEADQNLGNIFQKRCKEFFETFLQLSMGSFTKEYEFYKTYHEKKYQNILYVAFKVNSFLGDLKRAKYIQILLDKNKHFEQYDVFENTDSAVARVKSHLSYKIGSSLIKNKKKIHKIPFELYKIIMLYNKEKKTWDSNYYLDFKKCKDYKDALKVKNQLSYKLGEILINDYKNWYKGKFLILPYQIYKAVKKHKGK